MSAPTNTHDPSHPLDDAGAECTSPTVVTGHTADHVDIRVDTNWPRSSGLQARMFHLDLPAAELLSDKNPPDPSFKATIDCDNDSTRYRCYDARMIDGLAQTPAVLAVADSGQSLLLIADGLATQAELADLSKLLLDPPMDPAFVLFDVDGTLVDSLPAYIEVGRLAAEAHGYTLTEQFVRDTMNRNNHAFWELVVPKHADDRETILQSLRETSRQHWPRLVEDMVRPFAGVEQCLESLASQGRRLGIVTASGGGSMRALNSAGLDHFFDAVITRHDVANQKPAPDGIVRAMQQLSIDQRDTIYVGDSMVDVQAAHAAGVDCVAVTTGAGLAADLARTGPRRLIRQIETLPDLLRRA